MKIPRFKPVYFEDLRTRPWAVTIPAYLSPTGHIQRRFFPTLREAKEFAAYMRRQYDDHQYDATYLSRDHLGEATRAYDLIASVARETNKTYTLVGIVEAWAVRERQAVASVSLDRLFDEYIASRAGSRSDVYLERLRQAKAKLVRLGYRMISTLTASDIEAVLKRERPGTRNMLLSYLRAVLGWAIKRGWLDRNPVDRIERTEIKRREVEIYTPEEVQRILDDVLENDLGLLPYRVLTIYCGIRPSGEATKVEWSDINWADRIVKLRSGITKKGRPRYPAISDNAFRWLEEYRQRGGVTEGLIMPYSRSELNSRRRANLKRAGVKGIKNGSRHSYCSYHLAQYGDINSLTLQSGHANTDVLWRHYYQAATREESARYWSVVPKAAAANIVAFVKARVKNLSLKIQ